MKHVIDNLKDPITDLIGLGILIATLYNIYGNGHPWVWEGLIGCLFGLVLFLLPDSVIIDALKRLTNKYIDKDPRL